MDRRAGVAAELLALHAHADDVVAGAEGVGHGLHVDGEGAGVGVLVVVVEVVDELLDAHRGLGGQAAALEELLAGHRVRGGVDVDGEGGLGVFGDHGEGIEPVIGVDLGVGLLAHSQGLGGRSGLGDGHGLGGGRGVAGVGLFLGFLRGGDRGAAAGAGGGRRGRGVTALVGGGAAQVGDGLAARGLHRLR